MYSEVELLCINNINNNYYKKMADTNHSDNHSDCDDIIDCSQRMLPVEPVPKKRRVIESDTDSDDIDGISYNVTLDVFFKTCLLIFSSPFDFQRLLMFSLPHIKKELKKESKNFRKIVFAMIKAVHTLYSPKMKEFAGWESFYLKLTESTWSTELYDGTLMPNVRKFFENCAKMQLDSVDSSSSSSTTQNKTSSTSTSYMTATNQAESADAPLCLESILYDIPAPLTNCSLESQPRTSTISERMQVRTTDGLNTYESNVPMGDYYVTMRIIPASVVTNQAIQSTQWWKHAKQEIKFSVKERSQDPVSQATFRMIKEVTNKIVNSPNCTQIFKPYTNWNNF